MADIYIFPQFTDPTSNPVPNSFGTHDSGLMISGKVSSTVGVYGGTGGTGSQSVEFQTGYIPTGISQNQLEELIINAAIAALTASPGADGQPWFSLGSADKVILFGGPAKPIKV